MRKQKQFRIIGRPTLRAVDAAGAARGLGAIYASVLCRRSCRSMEVASGATDAVRWAATTVVPGAIAITSRIALCISVTPQ